nr:immunoglobulin heavy chain junction region [Mus musculus]NSM04186.1 immunoglobulin heavy chain junction region [Mus musculus]NSM05882.1 immunoglobulin heavy chain junction region [Mus musculus]NSM06569.1 immunoglobulin heavy chain junction region [Mus musculus]NSM07334.1 immunoglobulin heavy chain junction region [Mus musculus]
CARDRGFYAMDYW